MEEERYWKGRPLRVCAHRGMQGRETFTITSQASTRASKYSTENQHKGNKT